MLGKVTPKMPFIFTGFCTGQSLALITCYSKHQHHVLVCLVEVHLLLQSFVIEKALEYLFDETLVHKSFHGLCKQMQEEN